MPKVSSSRKSLIKSWIGEDEKIFTIHQDNNIYCYVCDKTDMDNVLERINVFYSPDIYEIISVLKKIQSDLKTNNLKKIVIIDSITLPYLPFVGVSSKKGISILNFISSLLKQLATEYNVAIIVTNLGILFSDHDNPKDNDITPLMGKYWQHIPNTRITITHVSKMRKLTVHKSDYLESNKTAMISIQELCIT